MAQFRIWLDSWEHQCCGDQRSVGQEIELNVFSSHNRLHEQRHDYSGGEGGGPVAVPMRGRLVALDWHRAVFDRAGIFASRLVGYGPGVACESTEDEPAADSWAFELTVESEDDPPADASSPEYVSNHADAAVYIALDWDPFHDEGSENFPPSWFGYLEYGDGDLEFTEVNFFSDALEAVRLWRGRSSESTSGLRRRARRSGLEKDLHPRSKIPWQSSTNTISGLASRARVRRQNLVVPAAVHLQKEKGGSREWRMDRACGTEESQQESRRITSLCAWEWNQVGSKELNLARSNPRGQFRRGLISYGQPRNRGPRPRQLQIAYGKAVNRQDSGSPMEVYCDRQKIRSHAGSVAQRRD